MRRPCGAWRPTGTASFTARLIRLERSPSTSSPVPFGFKHCPFDVRVSHLGDCPAPSHRRGPERPGALSAVNRLRGTTAGLIAAVILAASPATVALNRGNISDTAMALFLVLAADAVSAAIVSGRQRHLIFAGVWIGIAFQAKMLEAWLVLPAFGLAYLFGRNEGWADAANGRRRWVGRRRRVAVVDDPRNRHPSRRSPLRGREPTRLPLRAGLRLQRLWPHQPAGGI